MWVNKEKAKKIKESFTGEDKDADRKRRMELQSAEEPDLSSDEDSGFKKTEKEDPEVAEPAFKDKVTTGILKMLKKRGPPKAK